MKYRPARVKELILRELGAIINRELTFDAQLVSINEVDLPSDFKNCYVYVGVIGTVPQRQRAIAKLEENRGMLQREMAKRVILKYTPQLHFKLDETVERGSKIMEIMRQIDEEIPPQPPNDSNEDSEL